MNVIAQAVFDYHPTAQVVYMVDDVPFLEQCHADNYAASLVPAKTTVLYVRDNAVAQVPPMVVPDVVATNASTYGKKRGKDGKFS